MNAAKSRETSTGLYEMTVENPSRCKVAYSYLCTSSLFAWDRRSLAGSAAFASLIQP